MNWRHAGSVMLSALAGVTLLSYPRHPVRAGGTPVTWRGQVAPVVFGSCAGCHHTGGSAPFDLTTYASARRWGPQIADVVQSRYMPPWLPSPTGGPTPVHFEGDRHLRPADIEMLTAWVKAGMPEGTGNEPKPPLYNAGWQLGPPDLVLEMPSPVTEPASGSDLFVNFILPANVTRTRWVRAMEIQPGAGQLVHHANVILDRNASLRAQHPANWKDGISGMDLEIDSGDAFDPDSHFLFWKPDSTALIESPGMPWRLDPGNDLVLNMHLKPTGKPEQVRARIALYFTDKPATERPMLLELQHDAALKIPAGDADFVVTDELKLPVAVDLLGVYPHAHYLGHEMEGWATLPNGQRQPFLEIRSWDIDRQAVYRLATPLSLPAGSVLHMRYSYDNSAANVHNPASPPVEVHAGNRAIDEMGHLWVQVLPHGAGSGDPRLPLEEAWMRSILQKAPEDPMALYNLGSLELMHGRPQAAAAEYRRLLAHQPQDPRTLTSLGSALEAAGDPREAAVQFHAALTADPSYADADFDLASLELKSGQSAAAEAHFRGLLARRPEDTGALEGLAASLINQNRATEADPVLRHILALNSEDAEAHRMLATIYAADGNSHATVDELQAWARATPDQPDAHRALAQVFSAAGQPEQALAEQRTVVQLEAANAGDWNDLGALEARAGHVPEAARAFEHALKLDPGNQAATSNLSKLTARSSAK